MIKLNKVKINKELAEKKIKNARARAARANKKFESASPAQKRIIIARDVISQLDSKRFIPAYGYWVFDPNLLSHHDVCISGQTDASYGVKSLFENKEECKGCALGAMFMSAVKRANTLKVNQLCNYKNSDQIVNEVAIEQEDVFKYMKKYFS